MVYRPIILNDKELRMAIDYMINERNWAIAHNPEFDKQYGYTSVEYLERAIEAKIAINNYLKDTGRPSQVMDIGQDQALLNKWKSIRF